MSHRLLDAEALARALALRDLTDPAQGPHALQLLVEGARDALTAAWRVEAVLHRASPVVSVADNYDALHYPPAGAARDARYTRYVTADTLLRTQTSAMLPPLLRQLAREPLGEKLLLCPGLVYRRDALDRLHTGEPHQLDLWRVRPWGPALGVAELEEMCRLVAHACLPGARLRSTPSPHPYTLEGRQLDAWVRGSWVELGECGLALPALLHDAGWPEEASGLAMGVGLDRLLMVRKGLEDIRLLRSEDPRVSAQLLDLEPYRAVSSQPALARDLSLALPADCDAEELGDRVREALGEEASCVESVELLSETPAAQLSAAARARLGLGPEQKNALLRVVLRHLRRALTHAEANALRDRIYAALHRGSVHHWAAR